MAPGDWHRVPAVVALQDVPKTLEAGILSCIFRDLGTRSTLENLTLKQLKAKLAKDDRVRKDEDSDLTKKLESLTDQDDPHYEKRIRVQHELLDVLVGRIRDECGRRHRYYTEAQDREMVKATREIEAQRTKKEECRVQKWELACRKKVTDLLLKKNEERKAKEEADEQLAKAKASKDERYQAILKARALEVRAAQRYKLNVDLAKLYKNKFNRENAAIDAQEHEAKLARQKFNLDLERFYQKKFDKQNGVVFDKQQMGLAESTDTASNNGLAEESPRYSPAQHSGSAFSDLHQQSLGDTSSKAPVPNEPPMNSSSRHTSQDCFQDVTTQDTPENVIDLTGEESDVDGTAEDLTSPTTATAPSSPSFNTDFAYGTPSVARASKSQSESTPHRLSSPDDVYDATPPPPSSTHSNVVSSLSNEPLSFDDPSDDEPLLPKIRRDIRARRRAARADARAAARVHEVAGFEDSSDDENLLQKFRAENKARPAGALASARPILGPAVTVNTCADLMMRPPEQWTGIGAILAQLEQTKTPISGNKTSIGSNVASPPNNESSGFDVTSDDEPLVPQIRRENGARNSALRAADRVSVRPALEPTILGAMPPSLMAPPPKDGEGANGLDRHDSSGNTLITKSKAPTTPSAPPTAKASVPRPRAESLNNGRSSNESSCTAASTSTAAEVQYQAEAVRKAKEFLKTIFYTPATVPSDVAGQSSMSQVTKECLAAHPQPATSIAAYVTPETKSPRTSNRPSSEPAVPGSTHSQPMKPHPNGAIVTNPNPSGPRSNQSSGVNSNDPKIHRKTFPSSTSVDSSAQALARHHNAPGMAVLSAPEQSTGNNMMNRPPFRSGPGHMESSSSMDQTFRAPLQIATAAPPISKTIQQLNYPANNRLRVTESIQPMMTETARLIYQNSLRERPSARSKIDTSVYHQFAYHELPKPVNNSSFDLQRIPASPAGQGSRSALNQREPSTKCIHGVERKFYKLSLPNPLSIEPRCPRPVPAQSSVHHCADCSEIYNPGCPFVHFMHHRGIGKRFNTTFQKLMNDMWRRAPAAVFFVESFQVTNNGIYVLFGKDIDGAKALEYCRKKGLEKALVHSAKWNVVRYNINTGTCFDAMAKMMRQNAETEKKIAEAKGAEAELPRKSPTNNESAQHLRLATGGASVHNRSQAELDASRPNPHQNGQNELVKHVKVSSIDQHMVGSFEDEPPSYPDQYFQGPGPDKGAMSRPASNTGTSSKATAFTSSEDEPPSYPDRVFQELGHNESVISPAASNNGASSKTFVSTRSIPRPPPARTTSSAPARHRARQVYPPEGRPITQFQAIPSAKCIHGVERVFYTRDSFDKLRFRPYISESSHVHRCGECSDTIEPNCPYILIVDATEVFNPNVFKTMEYTMGSLYSQFPAAKLMVDLLQVTPLGIYIQFTQSMNGTAAAQDCQAKGFRDHMARQVLYGNVGTGRYDCLLRPIYADDVEAEARRVANEEADYKKKSQAQQAEVAQLKVRNASLNSLIATAVENRDKGIITADSGSDLQGMINKAIENLENGIFPTSRSGLSADIEAAIARKDKEAQAKDNESFADVNLAPSKASGRLRSRDPIASNSITEGFPPGTNVRAGPPMSALSRKRRPEVDDEGADGSVSDARKRICQNSVSPRDDDFNSPASAENKSRKLPVKAQWPYKDLFPQIHLPSTASNPARKRTAALAFQENESTRVVKPRASESSPSVSKTVSSSTKTKEVTTAPAASSSRFTSNARPVFQFDGPFARLNQTSLVMDAGPSHDMNYPAVIFQRGVGSPFEGRSGRRDIEVALARSDPEIMAQLMDVEEIDDQVTGRQIWLIFRQTIAGAWAARDCAFGIFKDDHWVHETVMVHRTDPIDWPSEFA